MKLLILFSIIAHIFGQDNLVSNITTQNNTHENESPYYIATPLNISSNNTIITDVINTTFVYQINEEDLTNLTSKINKTQLIDIKTIKTQKNRWNIYRNISTPLVTSVVNDDSVVEPINVANEYPDIRFSLLECINRFRSHQAERAADMNMLVWDYTLEGYASQVSKTVCSSGEYGVNPEIWPFYGGKGELAASTRSFNVTSIGNEDIADQLCQLVGEWNNTGVYLAKADYSNSSYWEIGERFTLSKPYLQLMLASASKIGCSFYRNCRNDIEMIVTCQLDEKTVENRPPFADIYKTFDLKEPQRSPCGRCGFGTTCCAQNLCIGRDIGSSCPTCNYIPPIMDNFESNYFCMDKYYISCSDTNCQEACLEKHQVPDGVFVNQCTCTPKQRSDDMLLFDQLPSDPQISYTEGWLFKKRYYNGLCLPYRKINETKENFEEYPLVGANTDNEETRNETYIGPLVISSDSLRENFLNTLNNYRSQQLAADMAMLVWDYTTEGYARVLAEKICLDGEFNDTQLGTNSSYPNYVYWPYKGESGQTLFSLNNTLFIPNDNDNISQQYDLGSFDPNESIKLAIKSWVDEGNDFEFENPSINDLSKYINYMMVVRAEATSVGCSIATNCNSNSTKSIIVCKYNYPNFKNEKDLISNKNRKMFQVTIENLNHDVPYLHIQYNPYLLLQQRKPCGRCRRGATCCENNLCVGVDISASSWTFVPPIIENRSTGSCRKAFIRSCNQLTCEVNCMMQNGPFLHNQCYCLSPDNINKLALATPDSLPLNYTLIESLNTQMTKNITRLLATDTVNTPFPIATYAYIFGLIQKHGLCITLPGYNEKYGNTLIEEINFNQTIINERNNLLLFEDFTIEQDFEITGNSDNIPKDVTDDFRQELLIAINSYRSIIGSESTNMNKLAYDFTLEAIAHSISKHCQISLLNNNFAIKGVKPITYLSSSNEILSPNNMATIISTWAKPLIKGVDTLDKEVLLKLLDENFKLPETTQQLFTASASSVGCSVFKNCPENRYFIVCQFNYVKKSSPPFKHIDDGINEKSSSCSCCGSKATCCENNLCVGGNSQAQNYKSCVDLSSNNLRNETCSGSFYKSCKDLGCSNQCLKPLDERDEMFNFYIFNQCTCSNKASGESPQDGLLKRGLALLRGECKPVNTTSLDPINILNKYDNLLQAPLISSPRNGFTKSQILSAALKTSLSNSLTLLDARPFLFALNKFRSEISENTINMNMIKWDYSLEGFARNWALVCLGGKENNSPIEFPYRGGNSEVVFASNITDTFDPNISPLQVVEKWSFGMNSYKSDNQTILLNQNILNYLTISQASTIAVGCSVVEGCPNAGYVVVCQFDNQVELNKPPYEQISNKTDILNSSYSHTCGKCMFGTSCCENNLCVGAIQSPNKLIPAILPMKNTTQCLNRVRKECNQNLCSKGCVEQIPLLESSKISLFNDTNNSDKIYSYFLVNQCQCITEGNPIKSWSYDFAYRNGKCENIIGYSLSVVQTQYEYLDSVIKKIETTTPEIIKYSNTTESVSLICRTAVREASMSLKCVFNPSECGSNRLCYSQPKSDGCFCQKDSESPECEALKICRRSILPIIDSIRAGCIGKDSTKPTCPCSNDIFGIECGCYVDPSGPGCPCDRNSKSLICKDLLSSSELTKQKIMSVISEITKVKSLRGDK